MDSSAPAAFEWFLETIKEQGYEVFLATPDVFTIRAKFPKTHKHSGLVADFVLARKEEGFVAGTRRPESCVLGTLEDDLRRRDFTVNAIAKGEDGIIIDKFDGISDLGYMILRCPIDAATSFNDDPLRILRAFRFSITKGFKIHFELFRAIKLLDPNRFIETVSIERIREELDKMFRFDTLKTIELLEELKCRNPQIYKHILTNLWLKPTTELK